MVSYERWLETLDPNGATACVCNVEPLTAAAKPLHVTVVHARSHCATKHLYSAANTPYRDHSASTARRVHKIRPASLDEIATITTEMPEQYRAMVLLAAWCALRFGELTELRRKDVIIVEPTETELANALANGEAGRSQASRYGKAGRCSA